MEADEHRYTRDSCKPQKSFQTRLASLTFLVCVEVVQKRNYLLLIGFPGLGNVGNFAIKCR